MRALLFGLLIAVFFFSCVQPGPDEKRADTLLQEPPEKKISYHALLGEAILLGSGIELLDDNYNVIGELPEGQLVQIIAVSDQFYKASPSDEACDQFQYVRVGTLNGEGIVEGRYVYRLDQLSREFKDSAGNVIRFTSTSYFGMPEADENGLTDCDENSPVVLYDQKSGYTGLVRVVNYEEHQWTYPYYEGIGGDSLEVKADGYYIRSTWSLMEGQAKLYMRISKDKDGTFTAEILEYEQTI